MTLNKAIFHKKEHREEYRGSKRFDRSCRNHGNCGYCKGNRTFHLKKADLTEESLDEVEDYPDAANDSPTLK